MAGAFNQFATGIGNTDAGFVMGTGKLLIKVPETMHFRLEGRLQPGVMAKDVILHCIGEIGFEAIGDRLCHLLVQVRVWPRRQTPIPCRPDGGSSEHA